MTKPTAPLHASLEPALRPLLAALCRARPQSPLARQLGGAARSEAPMSATPLSAAPLSEAPLSAAPLSQAPMPVALSVLPPAAKITSAPLSIIETAVVLPQAGSLNVLPRSTSL